MRGKDQYKKKGVFVPCRPRRRLGDTRGVARSRLMASYSTGLCQSHVRVAGLNGTSLSFRTGGGTYAPARPVFAAPALGVDVHYNNRIHSEP